MKIDNLNDLKKVIRFCQEHGVERIEVDGVKLELRPYQKPVKRTNSPVDVPILAGIEDVRIPTPNAFKTHLNDVSDKIETPDELTDDQLLFYSSVPAAGQ